MDNSVLPSTLLLTLLMLVGLIFFIRASVKARIQVIRLTLTQPEPIMLQAIRDYFIGRAYYTTAIDPEHKQITFEGNVRPSLGLAIFLSGLAAVGLLCLSLVLSMLWSQPSPLLLGLVLLSPIAGVFYWRKAGRVETVLLRVEPELLEQGGDRSTITITAHRDELAELQRFLAPETVPEVT
jgi:hypothetical protein